MSHYPYTWKLEYNQADIRAMVVGRFVELSTLTLCHRIAERAGTAWSLYA